MDNLEIERKFLVERFEPHLMQVKSVHKIRQGYMFLDDTKEVRLRNKDEKYYLTIKVNQSGIVRQEFEYAIPAADGDRLFVSAIDSSPIEKTRYIVSVAHKEWSVDVFHGENEGLMMAEIELDSVDESFISPDWLGLEVTEDRRYRNAYLSHTPFSSWNSKSE
ncbi:CYTH domain-containing protein [Hahella sp. CR1]|uniref:CYTH domain-containing protein n=1 Tax=Hahella sp. CR1 TaxID=2992807 RepID=UPI0024417E8A|nr:CYTH domain-containing protein [Hahella sp. CR1]MDG9666945.1 CYTH domain-containing protein [Hahella sp. CR1]